jgi:hypothetical protein
MRVPQIISIHFPIVKTEHQDINQSRFLLNRICLESQTNLAHHGFTLPQSTQLPYSAKHWRTLISLEQSSTNLLQPSTSIHLVKQGSTKSKLNTNQIQTNHQLHSPCPTRFNQISHFIDLAHSFPDKFSFSNKNTKGIQSNPA